MTQQNATASEEMSATSEELAAQAEQLQSISPTSAPTSSVVRALVQREPASPPALRRPAKTVLTARRLGVKPEPTRAGQESARPIGFALNLTSGGGDQRDAEFERM